MVCKCILCSKTWQKEGPAHLTSHGICLRCEPVNDRLVEGTISLEQAKAEALKRELQLRHGPDGRTN
jgi:hypothetical protein